MSNKHLFELLLVNSNYTSANVNIASCIYKQICRMHVYSRVLFRNNFLLLHNPNQKHKPEPELYKKYIMLELGQFRIILPSANWKRWHILFPFSQEYIDNMLDKHYVSLPQCTDLHNARQSCVNLFWASLIWLHISKGLATLEACLALSLQSLSSYVFLNWNSKTHQKALWSFNAFFGFQLGIRKNNTVCSWDKSSKMLHMTPDP